MKPVQHFDVVNELFPYFMGHPEHLPKQWRKDVDAISTDVQMARIVSDYIAGMTDRFALQEHARLIGRTEEASPRRA